MSTETIYGLVRAEELNYRLGPLAENLLSADQGEFGHTEESLREGFWYAYLLIQEKLAAFARIPQDTERLDFYTKDFVPENALPDHIRQVISNFRSLGVFDQYTCRLKDLGMDVVRPSHFMIPEEFRGQGLFLDLIQLVTFACQTAHPSLRVIIKARAGEVRGEVLQNLVMPYCKRGFRIVVDDKGQICCMENGGKYYNVLMAREC